MSADQHERTRFGEPGGPLDVLSTRAYLGTHDEIAVPDVVSEWAEGSFRAGFALGLALVERCRQEGNEAAVEPAIAEAVALIGGVS